MERPSARSCCSIWPSEHPARLGGSPGNATLAWLWSCACLLDPLLLAAIVGATIGAATESVPVGALAGLVTVLLFSWQRNHGTVVTRGWRRHRG